jgi:hypothetical protein
MDIDTLLSKAEQLDNELFGELISCAQPPLSFTGKVEDVPLEFQQAMSAQMRIEVSRTLLPHKLDRRAQLIRQKTGDVLTVVSCIPSDSDWILLVAV